MRARVVRAAFAAVLLPAAVGAQTIVLTESDALARLGPDAPRVLAARAAVDVMRADVLAAGRWPNPRVTFNREAVAGVTENMWMVAQPLPVTGRIGLEVEAAAARADAASSRADEQVRRLRADLRLAFASLEAAQTRERELSAARDRLRALADVLGRREAAGDAAGFDRLRAEREVLDVEADVGTAAGERARAQAMVAGFFAEAIEPSRLEAAPAAPLRTELPSVDDLVARAETARGDLSAFQRDVDAARLAERASGRRIVPEPEVVAGTKSSNAGSGDVGSIVSVHVAVPLFDRGRPERAAAQARARQAQAEAEALRRVVRAQITAWRAAVVERRATADRYRTAVDATSNQIERIAQVSYDAGERGILELLDAQRTSLLARVRQAALDAAVREAEIELAFASGWEIR